jgi:hypothetical protein
VWVLTGEVYRGAELVLKGLVLPTQYEFTK